MHLKFLIVDDERLSRDYIKDLIYEFVPDAEIFEVPTARSALSMIQEQHPDVLFLDIKMPGITGFEFLDMLPNRDFELVFITAHNQYAIRAIKEGATDYLLKPLKKSEFKETIERVIEKCKRRFESRDMQNPENYLDQKLIINFQQGIKMIKLKDIIYLKADNSYTTLYLAGNEKVITTKPIHRFERQLNGIFFFRIHKSYIVNLAHLKEYVSKDSNTAVMDDGSRLIVSRYRVSKFIEVIKKRNIPSGII